MSDANANAGRPVGTCRIERPSGLFAWPLSRLKVERIGPKRKMAERRRFIERLSVFQCERASLLASFRRSSKVVPIAARCNLAVGRTRAIAADVLGCSRAPALHNIGAAC